MRGIIEFHHAIISWKLQLPIQKDIGSENSLDGFLIWGYEVWHLLKVMRVSGNEAVDTRIPSGQCPTAFANSGLEGRRS